MIDIERIYCQHLFCRGFDNEIFITILGRKVKKKLQVKDESKKIGSRLANI
jgi:hypothetical protein